jgi:coproporphyrinogen III oxidase-like Fe-S oxidoreductase
VGRPHAGETGATTYQGHALTLQDELRSFVLFDLRDRGFLDEGEIRSLFGMALEDAMPEALAVWVDTGLLRRAPGGWTAHRGSPGDLARAALWAVPDAALHDLIESKRPDRRS